MSFPAQHRGLPQAADAVVCQGAGADWCLWAFGARETLRRRRQERKVAHARARWEASGAAGGRGGRLKRGSLMPWPAAASSGRWDEQPSRSMDGSQGTLGTAVPALALVLRGPLEQRRHSPAGRTSVKQPDDKSRPWPGRRCHGGLISHMAWPGVARPGQAGQAGQAGQVGRSKFHRRRAGCKRQP